MSSKLSKDMADLNEDLVMEQVKQQLSAGVSPNDIFVQLQEGMTEIGKRFQSCEYFLSELIMSGEMLKSAVALFGDKLKPIADRKIGTLVLATVWKDIHDIGKDIVAMVFRSNGFEVIDLGIDVPPERVVEEVRKHAPDIVGLSCLLTTCFENMKATVDALESAGLRDKVKVLVGGGPVDQGASDYCRADGFANNAQVALDLAKKMMGVK